MHFGKSCLRLSGLLPATTLAGLLTILPHPSWAKDNTGDVYVMTNQSRGNSVMVFHRDANGSLTFAGSSASGGKGAGTGADPLGSQGSLTLSEDNRLLFAVNAGSNSVSVFAISGDKLKLLNTVASGGTRPVSVTSEDNLVYVLNASGTPNISGFSLDPETNHLVPLAGSTQNLLGGAKAAPAQVSFSPEEGVLIVTEKATNLIDTFTLDEDGVAQPGVSFASNGTTPFGFSFGPDDILIVSDASGGPKGTSALSSYEVEENGDLEVITPALGDTERAACWAVVTRNGRFAYTANTGSNTISSYIVSEDGSLALLNAVAASTGARSLPLDMALSRGSRFLYLREGKGTVGGFRVQADGSLTAVTSATGVPSGADGIAAR